MLSVLKTFGLAISNIDLSSSILKEEVSCRSDPNVNADPSDGLNEFYTTYQGINPTYRQAGHNYDYTGNQMQGNINVFQRRDSHEGRVVYNNAGPSENELSLRLQMSQGNHFVLSEVPIGTATGLSATSPVIASTRSLCFLLAKCCCILSGPLHGIRQTSQNNATFSL
jgi:beta-glucanase (GH16 family)